MSNKSLIGLIVAVVLALVAWNSFYIVAQTERAVLLQFGRVVQPDVQPGLHVKIPYVNQVRIFDGRLLTLDSTSSRFLTLEKKALMVDAYAKWRVKDAERFYQATSGMKQVADERLARRLEASLRDQFGKRTLHESVSGERDALMADVTATLNRAAERELGIEVVDVRVKAIDLPREVNRSVFEPTLIVSAACCWPKPTVKRKSCAVMVTPRLPPSTLLPTARIRSSTPSTVACRRTAKASLTSVMCWCSTRVAISSATWRRPSLDRLPWRRDASPG